MLIFCDENIIDDEEYKNLWFDRKPFNLKTITK